MLWSTPMYPSGERRGIGSDAAGRVVRAVWVYIEIDGLDAALWLSVYVPGTPWPIAESNVADLVEPEAAPLACAGQTRAALAAKLKGERFLLTVGMAEDDWAELARVSVIQAQDLLLGEHGSAEQVIDTAWHGIAPLIREMMPAISISKGSTQ
jgi:hypothetical protein